MKFCHNDVETIQRELLHRFLEHTHDAERADERARELARAGKDKPAEMLRRSASYERGKARALKDFYDELGDILAHSDEQDHEFRLMGLVDFCDEPVCLGTHTTLEEARDATLGAECNEYVLTTYIEHTSIIY